MGIPGNGRVHVVPEAVDTRLFDPSRVRTRQQGNRFDVRGRRPQDGCSFGGGTHEDTAAAAVVCAEQGGEGGSNRFRFLSVFKWERRKGWDVLLDAYWSAFTPADAVVLVLRTYVPSFSQLHTNITAHIEQYALQTRGVRLQELAPVQWESGGSTELRSDSLTRSDVRDLLASTDAFVLPTRGEGWGLPVAEAMAMRLPVVVTNATGVLAYASEDNAYLIPVAAELDSTAFVQPDVAALRHLLRQVVHDSGPQGGGRAQAKAASARRRMQQFSPAYVSEIIADRLEQEARRRGWNSR